MSVATSLWLRLRQDMDRRIESLFQRRRVLGIEDDGRVRLGSIEPGVQMEMVVPALRGAVMKPGDDALTVRFAGRELVIDAIRKPGDTDDEGIVAGDGFSPLAARVDHDHVPDNGNAEGVQIGVGAMTESRGTAIGAGAIAKDTDLAVGRATSASGYISVALGWVAKALGYGSLAMGYLATAHAAGSIAFGHQANAHDGDSIAVGSNAKAIGAGAIALGTLAYAEGIRAWALGYNARIGGADTAMMKANVLHIERSDGVGPSYVYTRSLSGNTWRAMAFTDGDTFWIGNRHYGTFAGFFPNNKSIASGGPWNFRSAPVISSANLIGAAGSGWGFHDTGWRMGANGYTWAYGAIHGWGFGYIVQEAVV